MCFNQEYRVLRQDLEMYRWLVIFTLFSIPLNIQAKEMSETTRYAVVGLIGELVECAMFYSIMRTARFWVHLYMFLGDIKSRT